MNHIAKLDKYYNPIVENESIYSDSVLSFVEMVMGAKQNGKINHQEVSFLLQLILSKELQNEVKEQLSLLSNENHDNQSLLIGFTTKEKKYVL